MNFVRQLIDRLEKGNARLEMMRRRQADRMDALEHRLSGIDAGEQKTVKSTTPTCGSINATRIVNGFEPMKNPFDNPFNEGSFQYLLFELEQRPRGDLMQVGEVVDILKVLENTGGRNE